MNKIAIDGFIFPLLLLGELDLGGEELELHPNLGILPGAPPLDTPWELVISQDWTLARAQIEVVNEEGYGKIAALRGSGQDCTVVVWLRPTPLCRNRECLECPEDRTHRLHKHFRSGDDPIRKQRKELNTAGQARQGEARHGQAGRGTARLGEARGSSSQNNET